MNEMKKVLLASLTLTAGAASCAAMAQDCRTELIEEMPVIGKVAERGVGLHTSKMWMLGCECLDRNYAEFSKYKDYILPLGIGRIRLQAGWARCEREKGKFDFAWLDEPVDWAVSHGIRPTLDLSYGNHLYKGGGQQGLAGAIPSGEEGLAAWDRWIETLVTRYKEKVDDYLMWNEPDTHRFKNDHRAVGAFNARTARTIRRIAPECHISALQLARADPECLAEYFEGMGGEHGLFDSVCWHAYYINPDSYYGPESRNIEFLAKIAPGMKVRHTEAGCISDWADFFAMKRVPWTEVRQAKWDMRRMIGDVSRGIETSVFTICDLRYTGTIDQMNRKGLLRANDKHDVIGVKKAYHAVRNVVSVFDALLVRSDSPEVSTTDRTVSLFGWRRGEDPLFVFWEHGPVSYDKDANEYALDTMLPPSNDFGRRPLTVEWKGKPLRDPVWVDLFSGKVCAFPKDRQLVHSCGVTFVDVPVYDSPCILAERDTIPLEGGVGL